MVLPYNFHGHQIGQRKNDAIGERVLGTGMVADRLVDDVTVRKRGGRQELRNLTLESGEGDPCIFENVARISQRSERRDLPTSASSRRGLDRRIWAEGIEDDPGISTPVATNPNRRAKTGNRHEKTTRKCGKTEKQGRKTLNCLGWHRLFFSGHSFLSCRYDAKMISKYLWNEY